MKFLLSYKIFEKTSLIGIGVPYSVMQSIQRNYAVSDNAEWKLLKYKKDITTALHKPKNNLLISVCKDKLFIIFSYNNEFYIESYFITEKDDFGNEQWQRIERVKDTITNITKKIEKGKHCSRTIFFFGNLFFFNTVRYILVYLQTKAA